MRNCSAIRLCGLLEKSVAETLRLIQWRMRADVFQSFPRREFCQSAADPPWSEADCRRTNLVRSRFRVGNFDSAKNFFGGFRVRDNRIRSDPLGLRRTQSESAAELFRHLDYLAEDFFSAKNSASLRQSPRETAWNADSGRVRQSLLDVRRTSGRVRW